MKEDFRGTMSRVLRCNKVWFRIFCAEFIGSAILVAMGNGSVAQKVLGRGDKFNTFLSVNFSYAMALTFAIFVSGGVSGGHVNPAITLAMCFLGKAKWKFLPIYFIAQYLGCFFGSFIVYTLYIDLINIHDGGIRKVYGINATAGIFATYPTNDNISSGTLFLDQAFGAFMLCICILAVTDASNMDLHKGFAPIAIGLSLLMIGSSYGLNCGFAINPARDLSPRIFTALSGWGLDVFKTKDYNWFWIPVIAPHIGALVAALIYEFFIGIHWPDNDPEDFPGYNGQITLTNIPSARNTVTPTSIKT